MKKIIASDIILIAPALFIIISFLFSLFCQGGWNEGNGMNGSCTISLFTPIFLTAPIYVVFALITSPIWVIFYATSTLNKIKVVRNEGYLGIRTHIVGFIIWSIVSLPFVFLLLSVVIPSLK